MKDEYYLDKMKINDAGDTITMMISCSTHTSCVIIHAFPEESVIRLNKVLKGLND